ncbi:MAG: coproporphyrinogen III oxidase family protein [Syntrophales bacterium]|nr:coproporphyrinogen III oxidase family protein [Syntrophales bacterium]
MKILKTGGILILFGAGAIVARAARFKMNRVMQFQGGITPSLGDVDPAKPRLLYIHVPFCRNLCPYCSFHRVPFDEGLCRAYFQSLRREILSYKEAGFDFRSVYVGGGTPTVLVEELEETLGVVRSSFPIREVSVETNPDHLDEEHLKALKRAGVDRLSVVIQSFDDDILRAMGRFDRYGSGSRTAEAIRNAIGQFETLNADMIFNLPAQTADVLARDIETLIATGVDQITYYPLMVSDSARDRILRDLGSLSHRESEFYRTILRRLSSSYRASSVWCFSKNGKMIDEYIVNYDEYAGTGSGAIGYLGGICYANAFGLEEYIERAGRGEFPIMASRRFSRGDRVLYDFLMRLFALDTDLSPLSEKYGPESGRHLLLPLFLLRLSGGIRREDGNIVLTERGRYFTLIMMREFFNSVNNFRDYCRAEKN